MSVLGYASLLERGPKMIEPFEKANVQPSSVDLRLGHHFRVPDRQAASTIHLDGKRVPEGTTRERYLAPGEAFVLHPGEFVLGCTAEKVDIPLDLVCHIDGKSSLGRVGLIVHATAGYVDPGFRGVLTLEMANLFPVPLILYPGQTICQVRFHWLDEIALEGYSGRYQDDTGASESRYGTTKETTND